MSGSEELQPVDRDILEWIAAQTGDAALSRQLATPRVKRRDRMQTGFFVYFEPDPSAPTVAAGIRPVCPRVVAPDLLDGAGCDLFLRNGRLHYLEVYARGGFLPAELRDYRLVAED